MHSALGKETLTYTAPSNFKSKMQQPQSRPTLPSASSPLFSPHPVAPLYLFALCYDRCEIYLVQGVAKHRVSTGPLAPLLDQLDAVREQYATAVTEIVLEPGAGVETAGQSSSGGWGVFRRSKSMDKKKWRKGKRGSTGGEEMPAWFTRETAEK